MNDLAPRLVLLATVALMAVVLLAALAPVLAQIRTAFTIIG